jgi:hypothetical protein
LLTCLVGFAMRIRLIPRGVAVPALEAQAAAVDAVLVALVALVVRRGRPGAQLVRAAQAAQAEPGLARRERLVPLELLAPLAPLAAQAARVLLARQQERLVGVDEVAGVVVERQYPQIQHQALGKMAATTSLLIQRSGWPPERAPDTASCLT